MSDLDFNAAASPRPAAAAAGRDAGAAARPGDRPADRARAVADRGPLSVDDVAGRGPAGRWTPDARRPEEAGAGSGGRRGRHLRSAVAQHAAERPAAGVERRAAQGPDGKHGGCKRIGVEFSCFTSHLAALPGERVDIEPTLYRLRRRKDPDELARIRKAIAGTEKMYALARQIIEPGITEIEVFNRLQAAAVEEFGEMLTGTGNDYQCGARGGAPRNDRKAQDGELYILDLGPAFRGYFADNSRAFAVNRKPTDEQQTAWTHVMKVFEHVESDRQARARTARSCFTRRRRFSTRRRSASSTITWATASASSRTKRRISIPTGTTRSKSATSSPASRACTTRRSCGPACGWRTIMS